jgi:hypothetical protein
MLRPITLVDVGVDCWIGFKFKLFPFFRFLFYLRPSFRAVSWFLWLGVQVGLEGIIPLPLHGDSGAVPPRKIVVYVEKCF